MTARNRRLATAWLLLTLGACHGEFMLPPPAADPLDASAPMRAASAGGDAGEQVSAAATLTRAPTDLTLDDEPLPSVDEEPTGLLRDRPANLAGRSERTFSRVERRRDPYRRKPLPPAVWPR